MERSVKKQRGAYSRDLTMILVLISFLSALISAGCIIMLSVNMQRLSDNYERMVKNEMSNLESMDEISRLISRHQTLLYQQVLTEDAAKQEELSKRAGGIKRDTLDVLAGFSDSLRGTDKEQVFHDIYTGTLGYFSQADAVLELSEQGRRETALFYLSDTLENDAGTVNLKIDEFSEVVETEMEERKATMEKYLFVAKSTRNVALLIITAAAVVSVFLSLRLSDEIVNHDKLTGVLNYGRLLHIGAQRSKKGKLADHDLICTTISDFKYINQTFGSVTGDEVLRIYAQTISSFIEGSGWVARNGGDNFVILLHRTCTAPLLQLLSEMTIDIEHGGETVTLDIDTRCGIHDPEGHEDINDAVNCASIALNHARVGGSSAQVWFNREMSESMHHDREMIHSFQAALENEEFTVYYQPKVDLETGRLCGAEALARWIRDGKVVQPGSFIPLLEKEGLITQLDLYVFRRVCRDIRDWQSRGISAVRVSSNFSKLHLHNKSFPDDVLTVIASTGAAPELLEIELTESSGYEDFDALQIFVGRMQEAGVRVSIDDFGTGFSALSLVRDIPADMIKLDRSFLFSVHNVKDDSDTNRNMIANIVRMLTDLDRGVICEGVETSEQAEFLHDIGCRYAQGFLYDKPLPHDEFEKRLLFPDYR